MLISVDFWKPMYGYVMDSRTRGRLCFGASERKAARLEYCKGLTQVQPHFWEVLVNAFSLIGQISYLSLKKIKKGKKAVYFALFLSRRTRGLLLINRFMFSCFFF